MEVTLRPKAGLVPLEGSRRWKATCEGATFDLLPPEGQVIPSGWVLIESRLIRRGSDYTAKLFLDTGAGFSQDEAISPPITRKGTLHELVFLPEGVRNLRWLPSRSPCEFEQWPITLKPVGHAERIWRMVRRVVPMLFKHPKRKRLRVGLTGWRMLYDLEGAYCAAGRLRAYTPALTYENWVREFDAIEEVDRAAIRKRVGRMGDAPRISVLMPVRGARIDAVQPTLDSVRAQLYRNWELLPCDLSGADAEVRGLLENAGRSDPRVRWPGEAGESRDSLDHALRSAVGEFVAVLRPADRIPEHALFLAAAELSRTPDAVLAYSDEDELTAEGNRSSHCFKPDWNLEFLRARDYVSRLGLFRASDARAAGGFPSGLEGAETYDLALRLAEQVPARRVLHIPAVLHHRGAGDTCGETAWAAGLRALQSHLGRTVPGAKASPGRLPGTFRVAYPIPDHGPLISILIPTRDRHALLRCCVESILARTTYPRFEVLVIDNGSTEAESLAYLGELRNRPRVRVLAYPQPFNFSAINNFAAREANGEALLLLNNDTEVITPQWLEEMLGMLLQPGVGVVGAKLLFEDGRVQHAGDLVGPGGIADHAHSFIGRDDPGYCGRALVAQEYSAVTAACMMIRKALYTELGGLDADNLPVSFNDVDFCLRAREAGWRVEWTPYAELYHHESVSRGKDDTPEKKARYARERKYMANRWGHVLQHDPFYNPNLSYERPDFSLSHAPRTLRPWLE